MKPAVVKAADAGEGSPFGVLVSRARHDLRNSIGHILGFADMLLEDLPTTGGERARTELEFIIRTANHLIAQINDGLDARRLDSIPAHVRTLRRHIAEQASGIVAATERLLRKPRSPAEELFQDDLARIARGARHALQTSRSALAALSEPVANAASPGEAPALPLVAWPTVRLEAPRARSPQAGGAILVVDDLEANREMLSRRLSRSGYSVAVADSGQAALEFVTGRHVDLILLDIMMPGLNGVEVLRRLKAEPATQHIPVVMLSSTHQTDTVVNCITLGADDFLPKPFNATLLLARIESSLAKKRLHDQETTFLQQLQAERDTSERLLLNILPQQVAERLKQGEAVIADGFSEVTVLFSDFVGFTKFSSSTTPKELVSRLNEVFSAFDQLCEQHRVEKIKMIGDAFMVAGGVPVPRADHAEAVAELALAMQAEVARFGTDHRQPFRMRVGISSGPVIAGVIGRNKFAYDLWGDTVNLASRMETHAPAGGILVTAATYRRLKGKFRFKPGRVLRVKGKGRVLTYSLLGKVDGPAD